MKDPRLAGVPLLVLANKQDIAAKKPSDISAALKVNELKTKWFVQGCVARDGIGLTDGFEWIARMIKERKA